MSDDLTQWDYLSDLDPRVADAARECIATAEVYGDGSPEHNAAKGHLLRTSKAVVAEGEADRG